MGSRDSYLPPSYMIVWILAAFGLATISGSANPEPHPNPASPLTGPGVSKPQPNPVITIHPVDQYFARNDPASLNCRAEGDPAPNITWYKNGKQLEVADHQMVLPTGVLFFLRFIHTKSKNKQPDMGVYFCKATNIHGSVVSRNATISLAVLKEDFRQEPVNTIKSVHSTAILHCKPPRGEPEPEVTWEHNGVVLETNDRIKIQDDGDLVISLVKTLDMGEYVCIAKNKAGMRQSSPAQLTVLEKPVITRFPEQITADEGQTVEFHCDFTGDASTKLRWEKDGERNQQKWREKDQTLRIANIEANDAGAYTCIAENDAGSARAVGHLSVEYTPRFLVRPLDQTVAAGRTVTLQCAAIGNPLPTIFWKTKSQDGLLFQNKDKGRFFVGEDGTLRIERVEKNDEGTYSCHSLNTKGEALVEAFITVREIPPPVIRFAPQNQTLGQDSNALLLCQANGSPKPTIRWFKHGRPIQINEARYTQLTSGTLQISSLKVSDTGWYACKAISESGETTVKAYLTVKSQPLKDSDAVNSLPDISKLPRPPEKPVISDVTDTSLRLSWQQSWDVVNGYKVEYFAYGYSQTWETYMGMYTTSDVLITGLVPNTTYIFLVRSINDYGMGGPSPLSDLIRTLEKPLPVYPKPVINFPRKKIETRIKLVEVQLKKGEAVNASAIRVEWQEPNELGVVDSYVVQYRHIVNMGDRQNQRYGELMHRTLPYRPLYATIGGLLSYEYYEICVMAAYSDLRSPCSQPMKIQSGESVPSSPPVNIIIRRESDTQIFLEWSPPHMQSRKGEITAYQIRCFSEDGSHNCSRSTNSSTTSLRLEHLISGMNYNIEMAATTGKGTGKWSIVYSVGPQQIDITKEAWFIGLIVSIGSIIWLVLCVFTIWLCKNRKRQKKLKEQEWYSSGTTRSLQKNPDRNGSIVRKGYGVKDGGFQTSTATDSGLPPEFSTLLTQSRQDDDQNEALYNHPEMTTFYQKSGPVTPYATTTLLQAQNVRKQSSEQMFRPIAQGYHQQSGGSGDSNTDRSNTTDVSIESRDHTVGSGDSGHMTDENGMLLKQQRKGCRPGVPNNQANINWTDVLPPPPTHPPSDTEYLQEDQLYSEIPEERSRSPLSPVSVSQLSACSCPVTHSHQMPGYSVQMYDSKCNRCNSLRNFDNRPYSPQQIIQLQRQHGGYPPNMSRTLNNPHHQHSVATGRGGTPIYLHGYSQPWDCQPLPRGHFEYDFPQMPRSDGYNYTEPYQEGLIDHGTLKGRDKNKNIHVPFGAPPNVDYYPRDVSEIPGGPPGNYCEVPCRSTIEALNNAKNSFNMGDAPTLPCFEGYKIVESPPSSVCASEYKVIGEAGSQSGDSGKGQERRLGAKGRSSSEGSDLRDRHLVPATIYTNEGENQSRPHIYHSRSETSPPGRSMMHSSHPRSADSPILEGPDYGEVCEQGEVRSNERDSMLANWESMEDCSSVHSSSSNLSEGSGGQFLNEEDFANAVAHAAELSGLTVDGTTISKPSQKPVKKSKRHHRQARPPSPGYSTDSNYGTADLVHKSYPKSRRRKPASEQDTQNAPSSSAQPIPSLYKSKPPEGSASTDVHVQRNPEKLGLFKFSEDIPVV